MATKTTNIQQEDLAARHIKKVVNHCGAVQDLLAHTVQDFDVNIAILSGQYKDIDDNERV